MFDNGCDGPYTVSIAKLLSGPRQSGIFEQRFAAYSVNRLFFYHNLKKRKWKMTEANHPAKIDFTVDQKNLYREEALPINTLYRLVTIEVWMFRTRLIR